MIDGPMSRRRAFTLVELLVVIGIIAVLVGILLPALMQSRRQAMLVQCASNLRQYVMAMHVYAYDNKGFLPRFDPAAPPSPSDTGANTVDLADAWYDAMRTTYKLPHDVLFCPEVSDRIRKDVYDDLTYFIGGYANWVPRRDLNLLYPPEPGIVAYPVNGTEPIRGPIRMGERIGLTNPVAGDPVQVLNERVVDPATYVLAGAPQSDFIDDLSTHFRRGKFDLANIAWVDGHVERRQPSEMRLRYRSDNSWNCW